MKLSIIILLLTPAIFGQMIWFEPNQGQVHQSVQFLARSVGGYVYFERDRIAIGDVRMEFVGASATAQVQFEEPTGGLQSAALRAPISAMWAVIFYVALAKRMWISP